jgi:hypothetical protein
VRAGRKVPGPGLRPSPLAPPYRRVRRMETPSLRRSPPRTKCQRAQTAREVGGSGFACAEALSNAQDGVIQKAARAKRAFCQALSAATPPGHFEVRRVSTAGTFCLHNGQQFLSQALNGEMIGLEAVQDCVWNVIYYETLRGRFDERTRTITGAPSLKKDC